MCLTEVKDFIKHLRPEISFPIFAEYLANRVSIKLLGDHDGGRIGKWQRDNENLLKTTITIAAWKKVNFLKKLQLQWMSW